MGARRRPGRSSLPRLASPPDLGGGGGGARCGCGPRDRPPPPPPAARHTPPPRGAAAHRNVVTLRLQQLLARQRHVAGQRLCEPEAADAHAAEGQHEHLAGRQARGAHGEAGGVHRAQRSRQLRARAAGRDGGAAVRGLAAPGTLAAARLPARSASPQRPGPTLALPARPYEPRACSPALQPARCSSTAPPRWACCARAAPMPSAPA
jgi:hypothetical protein